MKAEGKEMEDKIIETLRGSRVKAVVRLSDKDDHPSYQVASYLLEKSYRIIPVNPRISKVLGQKAYPDLTSIPEKIDIVDVFRKSEDIPPIAELALKTGTTYSWMQEGIANEDAKEVLETNNIVAIMDRCIKRDHARFLEKL